MGVITRDAGGGTVMVNPSDRRRRVLALLAGAGCVPIGRPATAATRSPEAALAARLAALPRPDASAAAIGSAYLELEPAEAEDRVLAALVAKSAAPAARLLGAGDDELRRIVAAAQREDFRCGRTVSVKGWLLSRTEARICALAALA